MTQQIIKRQSIKQQKCRITLDARFLSNATSDSVDAVIYDGDFVKGKQVGSFKGKDVLITYLTSGKFQCTRNMAYADAVVTPLTAVYTVVKCTQVWVNGDGYEIVVNFNVPA